MIRSIKVRSAVNWQQFTIIAIFIDSNLGSQKGIALLVKIIVWQE